MRIQYSVHSLTSNSVDGSSFFVIELCTWSRALVEKDCKKIYLKHVLHYYFDIFFRQRRMITMPLSKKKKKV